VLALPTEQVHCLSLVSFHGNSTVWAGHGGQLVIWDVKKRVMVRTVECEGGVHCILQIAVNKMWTGRTSNSNDGCLLELKFQ
jgi:hypothetical protein